ncbi:MAG: diaminopimelate epimerase [Pseudomonadota bacterium]
MRTPFTKMHGLGNDFVVLDNRAGGARVDSVRARALADRREGIGFDQLLLLEQPGDASHDLAFRIFNADGGEVEHCGNGARCVAAYAHSRAGLKVSPLRLELPTRSIAARLAADGRVAVDMGEPDFDPRAIPLDLSAADGRYAVVLSGGPLTFGAVSMGNPHAFILHDESRGASLAELDIESVAVALQRNGCFPEGVNVGFGVIDAADRLRLRVFERGVGETKACGTGACAAVAIAQRWGLLGSEVVVTLPGGELHISWAGNARSLWMTGPAAFVFDGEIEL